MPKKKDKQCFVVSPIGKESSEVRERANIMLEYIILPAVKTLGYEAVRADQLAQPGDINDTVIRLLNEAPMVIANLTGQNPNVYYEMAIRHTLGKPLVLIAEKGTELPFDIRMLRTIMVDTTSPASVEEAKNQIKAQVKAYEENPGKFLNPVTKAITINIE